MWNKQATWCQCALIIWFVFGGASGISFQTLTWSQDLYWCVLFLAAGTIQFITVEHGSFLVDPHKWQQLNNILLFALKCIITSWWVGFILVVDISIVLGIITHVFVFVLPKNEIATKSVLCWTLPRIRRASLNTKDPFKSQPNKDPTRDKQHRRTTNTS